MGTITGILVRAGGIIFVHDVGWPFGRRDMYYSPATIPGEFINEFGKGGILKNRSHLSDEKGLYYDLNSALIEGGPRNGVLTAIEDFLDEYSVKYDFFIVEAQFGLGVIKVRGNASTDKIFNSYKRKVWLFMLKKRLQFYTERLIPHLR
jgi:hypothetical protein